MTDADVMSSQSGTAIPADDPNRGLAVRQFRRRQGASYQHRRQSLYDSSERRGHRRPLCPIDMNVPPGGGPPPHRHDFEEMFTLLEGELEFTFRGETSTVQAGSALNIPANAPHSFANRSAETARMLCMCAPAGQEEFFMLVGDALALEVEVVACLAAAASRHCRSPCSLNSTATPTLQSTSKI